MYEIGFYFRLICNMRNVLRRLIEEAGIRCSFYICILYIFRNDQITKNRRTKPSIVKCVKLSSLIEVRKVIEGVKGGGGGR